ncbi:MAG: AIR carboxylase family protein [Candidatus Heimdallarchaeum endolithica]|uniref:AIR carboxylase family protein n=1 Tax=Candidatus Heimdallarchaeum endolithica TaxID=2876572 RepID=A0A9Y1FRP2_9ARCH|nr:MAG: AIR carboxylase family protein [Candidatus Heimdallarchaeum endolithica]
MIDIIAGSKSDSKIVEKVLTVLEANNVEYKVLYLSAHRDHEKLVQAVTESRAEIFICIAGLAAALPGVVASITDKPVIGVPVSAALNGLDALLSIVQMPKGVPVATVGIDNGANAAYLAMRILEVNKSA